MPPSHVGGSDALDYPQPGYAALPFPLDLADSSFGRQGWNQVGWWVHTRPAG